MILALDLSTPRGALALVDRGGRTVYAQHFRAHRAHNALLFAPLKEALGLCGGGGPDAVVIGTGPGSYSGVRVAISAGIGVAMAFDVPLLGWPSADAASREGEGEGDGAPFLFVGDARRGKFFGAEIHPGQNGGRFDVELFGGDELGAWLLRHKGSPVWTFDPTPPAPAAEVAKATFPDPSWLGRKVGEFDEATIAELSGRPLEPVYLSAPFITMPKS